MVVAHRDWTRLDPRDEEGVIALLRDRHGRTPPMEAREIERILDTTTSFRLRNAAALALADLGAAGAAARIGQVLERPEVAPQSGTLLFALDELGASLPLDSFVNILRRGSFEGRAEALHFLDAGRISESGPEARARAVAALAALAAGADPEAAEAARDALIVLRPGADMTMAGTDR
ncbi:hypothetical protein Q8W71_18910 [Methylobacterium sp. NEAU 140]|uniref:hypothetical protein n=1 Tax=Methylobacterium sp. NEAU 140 TaxID=3064945 RepID=UPI0027334B5A|nr:hypothetical protein [Methylobacterium sp. NEAU 140]MDP4024702.1 hypothetical protein [Methylobacterium sp. NEAU 140]